MTLIDLTELSLSGRILDVGGGGEGIISRRVGLVASKSEHHGFGHCSPNHPGGNVIAIDARADELAETPDIGVKVIMDARDLKFLNNYFNAVTCFYSLMYMETETIAAFAKEAYRVMKPGAELLIWDAVIPALREGEIFETQLRVKINAATEICVGYGMLGAKEQTAEIICGLFRAAGFALEGIDEKEEAFCLRFTKTPSPCNRATLT